MLSITTGVAQGLILGPLVFIGLVLYISDFEQASKMHSFLVYADNITISGTLSMFNDNVHDKYLDEEMKNEELLR